jgi:hypothetical protein
MITNPVEYEYTLLTFMMYQRMAKEVYSVYRNTNVENAESREERIKMEIIRSIMKLKELKDREESGLEADEDDVEVFTKESIMQRIGLVKKSGYNFDKYLLLVRNDNNTTSSKQKGSDFDINDLLSGLFSKDDE